MKLATLPRKSTRPTSLSILYRKMTEADADASLLVMRTSEAEVLRPYPDPTPDPNLDGRQSRILKRLLPLPDTSAHVALLDGSVVGMAIAFRQDRFWGLSTLFVAPEHQGKGIGSELMAKTLDSASGAVCKLIVSSADPRAMRAYTGAGLRLNPCMGATGSVARSVLPATEDVREGGADDFEIIDDIDRKVRGGSRSVFCGLLQQEGARLLIARKDGARGFALHINGAPLFDGTPIMLGAESRQLAEQLFIAFLRETDGQRINLFFLTERQQWTFRLLSRLRFDLFQIPPIFSKGYRAMPEYWIPSGIFF